MHLCIDSLRNLSLNKNTVHICMYIYIYLYIIRVKEYISEKYISLFLITKYDLLLNECRFYFCLY